ncbi:MAG: ABC transporter permease/substrate-binding protein [Tepidisphaeraceae bacterium]
MLSDRVRSQLELLPDLLAQHLLLSLSALVIGTAISLPLGVLASRRRHIGGVVLGVAGVVQTVPSLALLALMVPLLGMIGFWPALIALVLYSMLPILRSTVTGLSGIDRAMLEAADSVGMTRTQRLRRVELPLAAPHIIAGIRTACVWVIGIATLATPVGQATLGNFIFTGLQTQNAPAVIIGCIGAATLAIVLDTIIRALEVAVRQRQPRLALGAGAIGTALLVAGLMPAGLNRADDRAHTIVVGAKTFTEQHILAELLSRQLRDSGFRVATRPGLGSQIAFDALASDAIDCYVDYAGTIWTNVMGRTDFPSRPQMLVDIKQHLASKYGIVSVGRLGFENTYALAMPRHTAERLRIRSISDLVPHARTLKLGGDVEFFVRPEWERVRSMYGLDFAKTVGMDATLMYPALAAGEVDVIAAFSSDGRIAAGDLVVLADDRSAFPPYDAIVLVSARTAKRPGFFEALRPLIERIDDDTMRMTNKLVDVDRLSPQQAAVALLRDLGDQSKGQSPETRLTGTGADNVIEPAAVEPTGVRPAGLPAGDENAQPSGTAVAAPE